MALQRVLLPELRFDPNQGIANEVGIVGARGANVKGRKFWNHMDAKAVYRELGHETFNNYIRASSIRNPFDKVVSWFFFGFHKPMGFAADKRAFNTFIQTQKRLPIDRNIYTIGGAICCSHFVRFEQLQTDVDGLISIATNGDKQTLPLGTEKKNRDAHRVPFQEYYDDRSKDLVEKAFQFELENFGYSFHGA